MGGFIVDRFAGNPIIRPGMAGLQGKDGENINGPSLIRVPGFVAKPLGKYYLYFAHHGGQYIRLAYADDLAGPWRIHAGGVMPMEDAPGAMHIASPDVHVDKESREIRMYFHQPVVEEGKVKGQFSFVALSRDGLRFFARPEVLGRFYFRVFRHEGSWYALGRGSAGGNAFYRSVDGLAGFEEEPRVLPGARHTAVWLEGERLWVVYSVVGEAPERLWVGWVDSRRDWRSWEVEGAAVLLEPEMDYEGIGLELKASVGGWAPEPVRQLRDPAIFEEAGKRYLLYSVAGEQGIAIAELKRR